MNYRYVNNSWHVEYLHLAAIHWGNEYADYKAPKYFYYSLQLHKYIRVFYLTMILKL